MHRLLQPAKILKTLLVALAVSSAAVTSLAPSATYARAAARKVAPKYKKTTYGFEFTFTNATVLAKQGDPTIVNSEATVDYQTRMAEQALKTCGDCRMVREENGYGVEVYKIIYPDGFYFVVATDPAVVEVQTRPVTLAQYRKVKERLDRDLFGAARAVGIQPSAKHGGGHIHFGWLLATNGDILMTRNILVDFANHPELANGVFGQSVFNAPPLAQMPQDRQDAFYRLIADVDAKKVRSVKRLIKRLHAEVYNFNAKGWDPPEKYHDLNVVRIESDDFDEKAKTFENRHFLAQNNADEAEAEIELIDGRITYLQKRNTPIPVDIPKNLSEVEKYKRFARYAAESGVKLEDFRKRVALVNPGLAAQTPAYMPGAACRLILVGGGK